MASNGKQERFQKKFQFKFAAQAACAKAEVDVKLRRGLLVSLLVVMKNYPQGRSISTGGNQQTSSTRLNGEGLP